MIGAEKIEAERIDAFTRKICEHKGWEEKYVCDPVFASLMRETVVMTIRAIEMCDYVIVHRDKP